MANALHEYRILVADADRQLASVLRQMLNQMGFRHIRLTHSGQDAFSLVSQQAFDFLITEWNMPDMDGITLVQRIRRELQGMLTLPIIMLTGRAEQSDVIAARDNGINEFVVKPFTAKSIFSRLERIVDFPRNFVVCDTYVGPDRRHREVPLNGKPDRRKHRVIPKRQPKMEGDAVQASSPQIWVADYSLKNKLGKGVTLPSIITPEVLKKAQKAIDAITNESLLWIKDNLSELNKLAEQMAAGQHTPTLATEMGEVALTVNSRGGTFGYKHAAEIAYMLYLFCTQQMQIDKKLHQTIVIKHIEVLQVMFADKSSAEQGAMIVTELKNLVNKFAA